MRRASTVLGSLWVRITWMGESYYLTYQSSAATIVAGVPSSNLKGRGAGTFTIIVIFSVLTPGARSPIIFLRAVTPTPEGRLRPGFHFTLSVTVAELEPATVFFAEAPHPDTESTTARAMIRIIPARNSRRERRKNPASSRGGIRNANPLEKAEEAGSVSEKTTVI